jgi:hypothetical protein
VLTPDDMLGHAPVPWGYSFDSRKISVHDEHGVLISTVRDDDPSWGNALLQALDREKCFGEPEGGPVFVLTHWSRAHEDPDKPCSVLWIHVYTFPKRARAR